MYMKKGNFDTFENFKVKCIIIVFTIFIIYVLLIVIPYNRRETQRRDSRNGFQITSTYHESHNNMNMVKLFVTVANSRYDTNFIIAMYLSWVYVICRCRLSLYYIMCNTVENASGNDTLHTHNASSYLALKIIYIKRF